MSLPHYDFDRLEALEELTKMPGYDASYVLALLQRLVRFRRQRLGCHFRTEWTVLPM